MPIKLLEKRWSRAFFLSAVLTLGTLTYLDSFFSDKWSMRVFDSGVISLFGVIWLLLYYLKPEWFKN
jgi:hypothetical protein